ncbi:MAG: C2H2-type zinc finger protein [Aigarchaeota archaeon]|nr:C2H2-type zinc finger protein [Aigarchaeota archaeon]
MAKKYKCPYCGESFSSEDSLHRHIRKRHRRPLAKKKR